jgi:hypothetical protein
MGVVNITQLQRVNETYQKDFMVLPYALLIPVLQELKISMLEVNNRDIVVVKERKGGLARPYVGTDLRYTAEVMRLKERILQTEMAYAAVKDDITNYKEKKVLFDAAKNKINHKTKEHPLEREIIADQIITVGEDIIDSLFHATRNLADPTPMGMVDGFNTILDKLVIAGEISLAKGNLVNSGALTAPSSVTDITAFTSLRDWLRHIDPKWRSKQVVLYIPNSAMANVKDALENKKTSYKDVTFDAVLAQLREDCAIPNLQIVSHYALGTGDRLILTEPGNFDLGMNTFSDAGFVQVRNPYENPNHVQYWMQWEIGTRVKNLHKRGFMMSDGDVTANPLSGDYDDSGSGTGVGI